MHLYFETERLIVRQYTLNDVDQLFQVMSDVRVHTYTKDRNNPWDERRTEDYVRYMIKRDFKTLDCFHGAVVKKGADQLIGLCGLNPYKENEPEIEFKIGVAYWGKGYATELGKQMIQDAFAATDIKGIYGMAQPENTASRRVLEKIGMKYLGNQIFRNCEDSFYYVANSRH
ncbi:MAG: GNAT family N-acetyltransferase [Lachnospiraceae bacterium]|nr:GNAT family N-acetyltransferase [Lachnospiraceae bacterium]